MSLSGYWQIVPNRIVAHVPARHPYVLSIDPSASVDVGGFDATKETLRGVDVVHVHFGYEGRTVDELVAWCRRVRLAGACLVVTVHDLDNPHLRDQRGHLERTGVLVASADHVITLSDTAARRLRSLWGRDATVIAHPPIMSAEAAEAARRVPRSSRALIWLGTVRPCVDLDLVDELVLDASLDVDVALRDDGWMRLGFARRRRLGLDRHEGRCGLSVMPRPTDDELARLVASTAILVLPYRWGTHSGMVELAKDVGTPSLTTPGGGHGEQGARIAERSQFADVLREMAEHPSHSLRDVAGDLDVGRVRHGKMYERVVSARRHTA